MLQARGLHRPSSRRFRDLTYLRLRAPLWVRLSGSIADYGPACFTAARREQGRRSEPVQLLLRGLAARHGGQRRQQLAEVVDHGHDIEMRGGGESAFDA